MARRAFWLLFIVMVVSLGFFSLKGFGKEQKVRNNSDLRIVSEKIEEILKNQQDIITHLKDIREQQDIIRIRASRR